MTRTKYRALLALLCLVSAAGMCLLSVYVADTASVARTDGAEAAFDSIATDRFFWMVTVVTFKPILIASLMHMYRHKIIKD